MGIVSALHRALEALTGIEQEIVATMDDGTVHPMKTVYTYPPHGGKGALQTPSIMHTWRFLREERLPGDWRRRYYTIRLQLQVGRSGSDTARLGELAAAFDVAITDALDKEITLNDGATVQQLRGEEGIDQPALYEWNNVGYIGLEYLLDLRVTETNVTLGG